MTKPLSKYEKERRKRIRNVQAISWFAVCPCGEIIPYGHITCKGHSRFEKFSTKYTTKCTCELCHRPLTTRTLKRKNGTTAVKPLVHYMLDGGIMVCHRCKSAEWVDNHKDDARAYAKVYYALHRDDILAYQKVYYALHTDKILTNQKEYYQYTGNRVRRNLLARIRYHNSGI